METSTNNNIVWHKPVVLKKDREKLFKHRAVCMWLTGLSGSGKSTLAHEIENTLFKMGCHTFVLDGDNVRHGLSKDLGFSAEDRQENIRRLAELVHLFTDAGVIVIAAFISPFREDRKKARKLLKEGDFIEIFCRCSLEECKKRDPKGLYKKVQAGEISEFTGISSPYEEPDCPEITVETDKNTVENCSNKIVAFLKTNNVL